MEYLTLISDLPYGLAALHFLLSTAVTIHALLHKRDVGASISWIGLAWLSPILGSLLYWLLGINRVRRRARILNHPHAIPPDAVPASGSSRDDHLASLEHLARRITHRSAKGGNGVRILHCGDEAYPAMLAAIEKAQASVALSTYILRDDKAGRRFIDALIRAQQRGVAVRVLVDGVGSGYFASAAYRRLLRSGVHVARFMHSPLPWRMPFLNLRTHKKVLVIDGRYGFTGGLNIGQENVLHDRPRTPVRDTHFAFDGPVVAELAEAFAADWLFMTGETLEGTAWFPDISTAGSTVARAVTSGPDQDLEKIEFIALQAIACARTSIQIMTPYFLPEDRLVTALTLASLRGVGVDIVLPERSNHRLVDWATRAHVGPLLRSGCRLWLNPPPFDHSKAMVVDGTWCLIGSSNWDMRSLRLNFELNMEIYDDKVAQEVGQAITERQGRRLFHTELDRRAFPVRLRDAGVRLLLPYL